MGALDELVVLKTRSLVTQERWRSGAQFCVGAGGIADLAGLQGYGIQAE